MKTRTSRRVARKNAAISRTEGVMGGSPCIAGHRIRVSDIIRYHDNLGYSPAEIVEVLPTIDLDQVNAAVRYYRRHKQEIDEYIAEEDALASARVNPAVPRRGR